MTYRLNCHRFAQIPSDTKCASQFVSFCLCADGPTIFRSDPCPDDFTIPVSVASPDASANVGTHSSALALAVGPTNTNTDAFPHTRAIPSTVTLTKPCADEPTDIVTDGRPEPRTDFRSDADPNSGPIERAYAATDVRTNAAANVRAYSAADVLTNTVANSYAASDVRAYAVANSGPNHPADPASDDAAESTTLEPSNAVSDAASNRAPHGASVSSLAIVEACYVLRNRLV